MKINQVIDVKLDGLGNKHLNFSRCIGKGIVIARVGALNWLVQFKLADPMELKLHHPDQDIELARVFLKHVVVDSSGYIAEDLSCD